MSDVMDILANASFWVAVLRTATPLLLGTLGVLLFERAGGFHGQRQTHPAAEVIGGVRLQLIGRQRGDQSPDRFMVLARSFVFQHRRNEDALAGGSQSLAIGFEGAASAMP